MIVMPMLFKLPIGISNNLFILHPRTHDLEKPLLKKKTDYLSSQSLKKISNSHAQASNGAS
jgi:hypothetical protein